MVGCRVGIEPGPALQQAGALSPELCSVLIPALRLAISKLCFALLVLRFALLELRRALFISCCVLLENHQTNTVYC